MYYLAASEPTLILAKCGAREINRHRSLGFGGVMASAEVEILNGISIRHVSGAVAARPNENIAGVI